MIFGKLAIALENHPADQSCKQVTKIQDEPPSKVIESEHVLTKTNLKHIVSVSFQRIQQIGKIEDKWI